MYTTTKNKLLYKSKVGYADWALNHVVGCSHGCAFPCYAYLIAKRFNQTESYSDWGTPKLVENALELLDKEIPKYKDQIKSVHLCFTTDPFMCGFPEITAMSLKIIKKLNDNGIKCVVLTKGILPTLLSYPIFSKENEYGITLVSLDDGFKDKYEPKSASYAERIYALKLLHLAGCKTWVSMEPYPTPNIVKQDLIKLLDSVSVVDRIVFGRMNYNQSANGYACADGFYESCVEIIKEYIHTKNLKTVLTIKKDKRG